MEGSRGFSFRWNDKSGERDREIPAFAGIGSVYILLLIPKYKKTKKE
jgi:hypothetical protein